MSTATAKKGEVIDMVPEQETPEVTKQTEEQEKTIFGKVDDKIMSRRAAKAAKKEAKAQAKEQKASEGKKFNWKKAAAITAGVVGVIGTVMAVAEHNQPPCEQAEASNTPTAEVRTEPVVSQETETAKPAESKETKPETQE